MIKIEKKWLLLLLIPAAVGLYFFMTYEDQELTPETVVISQEEETPTTDLSAHEEIIETPLTQEEPKKEESQEEVAKAQPATAPAESTPAKVVQKTKKRGPAHVAPETAPVKPQVVVRQQTQNKTPKTTAQEVKPEPRAQSGNLKTVQLQFPFDKKTLGYKHWSGRHFPTKWILKLNDQVVLVFNSKEKTYAQKMKTISINPSETLHAHFDWEFLGGKRKGWKEIDYKVDPNTDKFVFSFDWKDEPAQLRIAGTQYITDRSSNNKKE